MALVARPISLRDAADFVAKRHRHHPRVIGGKFAVAAVVDGRVVGVVIAGRPKARMTQQRDPLMGEVTRICTDGTPNACSFLYSRARRIMQLMGYERFQTFVLDDETGGSVVADGWTFFGVTEGGSWNVPSRPRTDKHPTCPKKKFIFASKGI